MEESHDGSSSRSKDVKKQQHQVRPSVKSAGAKLMKAMKKMRGRGDETPPKTRILNPRLRRQMATKMESTLVSDSDDDHDYDDDDDDKKNYCYDDVDAHLGDGFAFGLVHGGGSARQQQVVMEGVSVEKALAKLKAAKSLKGGGKEIAGCGGGGGFSSRRRRATPKGGCCGRIDESGKKKKRASFEQVESVSSEDFLTAAMMRDDGGQEGNSLGVPREVTLKRAKARLETLSVQWPSKGAAGQQGLNCSLEEAKVRKPALRGTKNQGSFDNSSLSKMNGRIFLPPGRLVDGDIEHGSLILEESGAQLEKVKASRLNLQKQTSSKLQRKPVACSSSDQTGKVHPTTSETQATQSSIRDVMTETVDSLDGAADLTPDELFETTTSSLDSWIPPAKKMRKVQHIQVQHIEEVIAPGARLSSDVKWIPPVSPYGLIQEQLYQDPWKVLVACMLLNKTGGRQMHKVIWDLFELCPHPEACLTTETEKIGTIIRSLGLQNKRAKMLQRFSEEYAHGDWTNVSQLHGIGEYARDAYAIFCEGRWREVQPNDYMLKKYWQWLCETQGLGYGFSSDV
ncbi:unnamed protein product [Sphagnum compactum]